MISSARNVIYIRRLLKISKCDLIEKLWNNRVYKQKKLGTTRTWCDKGEFGTRRGRRILIDWAQRFVLALPGSKELRGVHQNTISTATSHQSSYFVDNFNLNWLYDSKILFKNMTRFKWQRKLLLQNRVLNEILYILTKSIYD